MSGEDKSITLRGEREWETWSISKTIASAPSQFGPSQLGEPEMSTNSTLSAGYLKTFAHFFLTSFWSPISRRVKIRKSFNSEAILYVNY